MLTYKGIWGGERTIRDRFDWKHEFRRKLGVNNWSSSIVKFQTRKEKNPDSAHWAFARTHASAVEVTGWVPEDEYLHHLSRIDASFLNGSFPPRFSETSKLSFPLKIHSYIQAQKPMLAFGPSDSSVVRFVQDYQCGAVCTEFNLESLSSSLDRLISNQQVYEKTQTGVIKLKQVFSREQFFENFENFLQV